MAKVSKKIQREVVKYIAETFNTKPYDWLTDNHFVDYHGFDGYIFPDGDAAYRYLMDNLEELGSTYQSAQSDEDWVELLEGIGFSKQGATKTVKNGDWKTVAREMIDYYNPSFKLSSYSGQIHTLSNGYLLYY